MAVARARADQADARSCSYRGTEINAEEEVLNPEDEEKGGEELEVEDLENPTPEVPVEDGPEPPPRPADEVTTTQSRSNRMYMLLKAEIKREKDARRRLEAQVEDLRRISSEISSQLGNLR